VGGWGGRRQKAGGVATGTHGKRATSLAN